MKSQHQELHDSIVSYIESKGFDFLNSEDGKTQTYFIPGANPPVYIQIYEDCDITIDKEGDVNINITKDHLNELHKALGSDKK